MGENTGLIIGIVVAVAIVLIIVISIVGWYISTLNNFRRMGVKIDEANSGIDVALTKRFDLLTKSVATVKGYAKHELETLEKVIAMRQPDKGASMKEKSEFNQKLADASKSLNIVMEQYPDLKADSHFLELQVQIKEVEEHLQAARRLYNSNVSTYNQLLLVFPSNIVANKYGFTKRDFFEAEEVKRQDVKIEF